MSDNVPQERGYYWATPTDPRGKRQIVLVGDWPGGGLAVMYMGVAGAVSGKMYLDAWTDWSGPIREVEAAAALEPQTAEQEFEAWYAIAKGPGMGITRIVAKGVWLERDRRAREREAELRETFTSTLSLQELKRLREQNEQLNAGLAAERERTHAAIATAVAAEREACAAVADRAALESSRESEAAKARSIAARMRARGD